MSDWKTLKLGEIGFFTNGLNKDKDSFGFGIPFVNLLDIFDKSWIETNPKGLVNVSSQEINRYNLIKGDVLFVRSSVKPSGVATTCVVLSDLLNVVYSGFIIRFRQHSTTIIPSYAKFCFDQSEFRTKAIAVSTVSANTNINQESLKAISIQIPPVKEQRKIAKILTTVDNLIEKTQTLIDKYQSIKHGMMHDLFTRGVDQNGKLRPTYEEAPHLYKESELGWIPKEWTLTAIENNLSQIIDYRGKTPNKTETGTPLITAKNVRMGFIDEEPREFIAEKDYKAWMTRGIPPVGSVLFTTEAPLGNVAKVPNYKLALAQRLLTLVPNPEVLESDYLLWLLQWKLSYKRLEQKSSGSTVTGIKQSVFRKIEFQFPKIKEQKSIAKNLNQVESKMTREMEYLSKLELKKKGLMQDLLTGKVRVKVDKIEEEVAS